MSVATSGLYSISSKYHDEPRAEPDASANVGPAARHGTSLTLGKNDPMKYRSTTWRGALLSIAFIVCGCTKWDPNQAPAGFAVVREHAIIGKVVFRDNLPVSGPLAFMLTEIDGAPITRETIPPWVHLQRGALVSVGAHRFKALARPVVLPRYYQPKEVAFVATVESRKVYYLIDKDGMPVLSEAPLKTR